MRRLAILGMSLRRQSCNLFAHERVRQVESGIGFNVLLIERREQLDVVVELARVEAAVGRKQGVDVVGDFGQLPVHRDVVEDGRLVRLNHQVEVAEQRQARALAQLADEAGGLGVELALRAGALLLHAEDGRVGRGDACVALADGLERVHELRGELGLALVEFANPLGHLLPLGTLGF